MRRGGVLMALPFVLGVCFFVAGCSDDDGQACGNNETEGNETCDGSDLGGTTCVDLGFTGGVLACEDTCTNFDTRGCNNLCNNGVLDPGEDCDATDLDGETCWSLGFDTGTLACGNDCTFDTSGCTDFPTTCTVDELVSLSHGQALALYVDTNLEDQTADGSCEGETGTPDRVTAVVLDADGDLVVTSPGNWHVFTLFPDVTDPAGCYASADEIGCHDPYYDGPYAVFAGLSAGTYYLVVSDWDTSGSDVLDYTVAFYPAGGEICNNGVDEDGDSDVDCDDADCAAVGYCLAETCDNGTDDDLDGTVDCLDFECVGDALCTGGGCAPDLDLGAIDSTQDYPISIDTTSATVTDDLTLPCAGGGGGEYVIAFSLAQDALVNLTFTHGASAHFIGFFFEGGQGSTCLSQAYFCFEAASTDYSGSLTGGDALPPGNYYFIVEANGGGGQVDMSFAVTLVCPAGMHDENGVCVPDTCADIDCASLNMDCNDTPTPSVCEGCLNPYVQGYNNRCIVDGIGYGDPCEKAADCPGTGEVGTNIRCLTSTGGYCYAVNTPECAASGQPCTDDPDSICIHDPSSTDTYCVQDCAGGDPDCRPGYHCMADLFGSGLSACDSITDCANDGCNDPGGTLYCTSGGTCMVDGCAGNPCATVANSNGTCINVGVDYACECNSGYIWNGTNLTCDVYVCPAVDLGTFTGALITQNGDSCTGTDYFGNTADGCTGSFAAAGQELVYSLTVPNGSTINVTQTPTGGNGQDSSLYLITACDDFDRATCLAGADDTLGGEAETLQYTNNTGNDQLVYIVLDAYAGCGTVELTVN